MVLVAIADPMENSLLTFALNVIWAGAYGMGWAPITISDHATDESVVSKLMYAAR